MNTIACTSNGEKERRKKREKKEIKKEKKSRKERKKERKKEERKKRKTVKSDHSHGVCGSGRGKSAM